MKILPISQERFGEVRALAQPHISDSFNPPQHIYSGVAAFDEDGTMLAYISLFPEQPGLYSIPSLATRVGWEGRGVMKELFEELFKMLPGTYWLEVHPSNERARMLYEKLGFTFSKGTGQYNDGTYCLMGERK